MTVLATFFFGLLIFLIASAGATAWYILDRVDRDLGRIHQEIAKVDLRTAEQEQRNRFSIAEVDAQTEAFRQSIEQVESRQQRRQRALDEQMEFLTNRFAVMAAQFERIEHERILLHSQVVALAASSLPPSRPSPATSTHSSRPDPAAPSILPMTLTPRNRNQQIKLFLPVPSFTSHQPNPAF